MRSSEVRKKWKREKIKNYTRRSQEEKQPMERQEFQEAGIDKIKKIGYIIFINGS